MKIINAIWEKRNLGLNVLEFQLEKDDIEKSSDMLTTEISQNINLHKAGYCVLKMPVAIPQFIDIANKLEFIFSENQFSINGSLVPASKIASQPMFNKRGLFCIKNSSHEMFELIKQSTMQGIFGTDRIALDAKFGKEISNRRYANWISDIEKKDEKDLRTVFYNDEFIGFLLGMSEREKKKIHFPLGGVVPKYKNTFGALVYGHCFKSFSEDYKYAETSFSSNNPVIINLYSYFGFQFSNMQYVFVKHII